MANFWQLYGEAAKTALGFFWKAGWAFIMGYSISAAIQTFVPKKRLTRHMGDAGFKSISIATVFGSISSSCSFAALAAARSLVMKGAHFVAAVAFMFASTNLVIELGILILIFLGWPYLAAELIGGLVLITISSILIKFTYPQSWFAAAREKVERESEEEEEDFSPLKRIKSARGWRMVGHSFVMEWQMVWQEILIGFTVAGFVKVFVPNAFWEAIFLMNAGDSLPQWLITLENAMVAPFVAAMTFIGSMGNIPLATVLAANGVAFAGIMGFIYSDLMVPPLVKINAKYYGWKTALYIAAVMFVSIVITALLLHYAFLVLQMTPQGGGSSGPEEQFKIDYTFWFNLLFLLVAGVQVYLHRQHRNKDMSGEMAMDHGDEGVDIQKYVTYLCIAILVTGLAAFFITSG